MIIHFGELWLRGKNRSSYISKLIANINRALSGLDYKLEKAYDRLLLHASDDALKEAEKRLAFVFGISNYEIAYVVEPTLESIAERVISIAKDSGSKSINVNAHRSYKQTSFDSNDIIKEVSKRARDAGIDARFHNYQMKIFVNVSKGAAYVYADRHRGLGGLPVGSEGKCIVLLSGGIDSPVAAWFAMKRGLSPVFLHVHAFQNAEEASRYHKIKDIVSVLGQYGAEGKIYYAPSYYFDAAAAASNTGRYTLILVKNFMLRLAQRVAKQERATAIVTGESLGQVASQTLENLTAESYGISLLILRPLIGFDKEEIIDVAKKIGTYELSIMPYKDVCSISAKNPKTKCTVKEIRELAKKIGMGKVVNKTLKSTIEA